METLAITVAGVLLATVILWLTRETWKYLRPVAPDVRLGTVQRVFPPKDESPPAGYALAGVEVRLVNKGNRDLHDVTFGIEPKGGTPSFAEPSTRRLRVGNERTGTVEAQIVERSDDPLDEVLLLARFRVHGRVWEAVLDLRKNRHYFRLRSRGEWSDY